MKPYVLPPLPGEDNGEPWVAPKQEDCAMCKARGQRQCFIHAGDLPLLPDETGGRCRHCGRRHRNREQICPQCWDELYDARPEAHVGASALYERI